MEDGLFHIYNEGGMRIEGDFETFIEAEQYAILNGYLVTNYFATIDDYVYIGESIDTMRKI